MNPTSAFSETEMEASNDNFAYEFGFLGGRSYRAHKPQNVWLVGHGGERTPAVASTHSARQRRRDGVDTLSHGLTARAHISRKTRLARGQPDSKPEHVEPTGTPDFSSSPYRSPDSKAGSVLFSLSRALC